MVTRTVHLGVGVVIRVLVSCRTLCRVVRWATAAALLIGAMALIEGTEFDGEAVLGKLYLSTQTSRHRQLKAKKAKYRK